MYNKNKYTIFIEYLSIWTLTDFSRMFDTKRKTKVNLLIKIFMLLTKQESHIGYYFIQSFHTSVYAIQQSPQATIVFWLSQNTEKFTSTCIMELQVTELYNYLWHYIVQCYK